MTDLNKRLHAMNAIYPQEGGGWWGSV